MRNRSEIASKGKISKSFNVPLPEILNGAFLWTNTDFEIRYGVKKPEKDAEFVISCQSGKLGLKAQTYLKNLGYQEVKYYKGGFIDWIANGGEINDAGNNVDDS